MKSDAELLQWFNDRLVWNSPTVVNDLLRNGLFIREFAPQVSMHDAPSYASPCHA